MSVADPSGGEPADQGAAPPPPGPTTAKSRAGDKLNEDMTVGELVFEVADQVTVLVREEVELAKTEVSEKVGSLVRGSVVGVVAGVFVLLALAMFMHAFAWLLNDLFFEGEFWVGFMIEGALFLAIAGAAGYAAWRAVRKGTPPTPEMAIEEAKEIRSALRTEGETATATGGE